MLSIIIEIFKSETALFRPKGATRFFRHPSADGIVSVSFPPGGGLALTRGY